MLADNSLALIASTNERNLTLSDLINEYLFSITKQNAKDSSYLLNDFLSLISNKYIDDITIHDIQNYISYKQSQNLKSTTLYKYFILLRVVFDYAVSHEYLTKNPCVGIKLKYNSKQSKHTIDYSKKYIRKLLKLFKHTKLYYIVLIAVRTRYA